MQTFELVTAGVPSTPQEYRQAMQTPLANLPELSDTELAEVERLKVNLEMARRHLEIRRLARERETQQGLGLQRALDELLAELHSEFRVVAIRRTGPPDMWSIHLAGDQRQVRFSMSLADVASWLVGSVSNRELEHFRSQVAEAVEPRRLMKAAG